MDYVFNMDNDQLNDVALYLNFTMLGSPNAGFFTDDGDQSGPPSPDVSFADVPEGSAGIERTLDGYLSMAGKRPADMPLTTRADYHPFMVAGVPIGGMTTGSAQMKTIVPARLWGGQAGAPFDPNYQSPRDTVDNINREALAVMGSGVAFAVGTYAESVGDATVSRSTTSGTAPGCRRAVRQDCRPRPLCSNVCTAPLLECSQISGFSGISGVGPSISSRSGCGWVARAC